MVRHKLVTQSQKQILLEQSQENRERSMAGEFEIDFAPVVKLFSTLGNSRWLLTEMNEEGIAFGLCDLGQGLPELGYVDVNELERSGLVERDMYFTAKHPLSVYSNRAKDAGQIQA